MFYYYIHNKEVILVYTIYNVLNYGAVADDTSDDTQAIQKALDAAHQAGGGRVYIPQGTYIVSGTGDASDGAIRVYSNTELYGDGIGQTEIKVADGYNKKITGVIRTPVNEITENVVIRDLTINGNNTGEIDGIMTGVLPGSDKFDNYILIENVEIHSVTRIAFNPHEQTQNITIRNSVAHHNGWDGFIADFVSHGVYENNIAYSNGRHGFNVVTHSHDFILRGNKAYDNTESGIVVQRGQGSPDSPNVHDFSNSANEEILVINNDVYDNGIYGILLKMTRNSQVIDNHIYDNAKEGIKLEGSDRNIITQNRIENNGDTAILVKNYSGSIDGPNDSHHNIIFSNNISGSDISIKESHSSTVKNIYAENEVDGNIQINNASIFSNNADGIAFSRITDSRKYLPESIEIYQDSIEHLKMGTSSSDTITGTSQKDVLIGREGNDYLNGRDNDDLIIGESGEDTLIGGKGNDTLVGYFDNNSLYGNSGDDQLFGGSSHDYMRGGKGDDYIEADAGDDTLIGDTGNDYLYGGSGNDLLEGRDGADTLDGGSGQDTLIGGKGNDFLYGSGSSSLLVGNTGDDTLIGRNGDDTLVGNHGNDQLYGGHGNNLLVGGNDNDTLNGGKGEDLFLFYASSGKDVIEDFTGAGTVFGDIIEIDSNVKSSIADILSSITYLSGNAVIDLGSGHQITLIGVASGLTTDDFSIV